jgi:hypothetical protein
MEYRENAWILKYKEPAWEKMYVRKVSNPSQALPAVHPEKGRNRDPAAMEETCAKSAPYSFEALHSKVRRLTE